jgi:hypothetical protein
MNMRTRLNAAASRQNADSSPIRCNPKVEWTGQSRKWNHDFNKSLRALQFSECVTNLAGGLGFESMKKIAFVTWLFSGDKKKQEGVEGQLAAVVAGVPVAPATSPVTAPVVTAPAMTETTVTVPAASTVTAPVTTETTAPVPATPTASVAAPPMAGYTTTNTYSSVVANSATTEAGSKASSSTTSHESDSTGDPYEDFILHMQSGKRPFRKPGITVKQEFELWLAHRAKTHQAAQAAGGRTKVQA